MLDTMKMSGMRPSSRICDGLKFRFHCCRTIRVLSKPGIDQGRADGPHAGGHHPQVGIDERQDARAMIERTGDDRRQIVPRPRACAGAGGYASFRRVAAEYHPCASAGQFHRINSI